MAPGGKADVRSQRQWPDSLSDFVLDFLASKFSGPTPVQAACIPLFLRNSDVVVEAVTGSGKTLAFLIPVIERILRLDAPVKKHHIFALIISPTRELAHQTYKVLLEILSFSAEQLKSNEADPEMKNANSTPVYPLPQLVTGGDVISTKQDLSDFLKRSPQILIGTPGRLESLLSSPYVKCPASAFEVLVLDEADRLLDMGFKDELQKILARLPKQRRTGLFSASMSEGVERLIYVGLKNPVRIAVRVKATGMSGEEGKIEDKRTPASLQLSYLILRPDQRLPAIRQLLSATRCQKTIIFLATVFALEYFKHIIPAILKQHNIITLHGQQPQKRRKQNLSSFVDCVRPVCLLTTDVAARGLDIDNVDLVIQLDPPKDLQTFIHRSGRSGRAGRRGLSVLFVTPGSEEAYIDFLRARKLPITLLTSPTITITPTDASHITAKIRSIVKTDRAIYDKAQRGFPSFIRAYSQHTPSSIFRVSELEWKTLGDAWGLLRLPRMPELKDWKGDMSLGVELDWRNFSYKDPQREKQRELNTEKDNGGEKGVVKYAGGKEDKYSAWSQRKEQKATKEMRREKKKTKREHDRVAKMTEEERQKEDELKGMIEQVRKQVAEKEDDEEFLGFSD